jgi:hypothetical protein
MVSTRHQVHVRGNDDELFAGIDSKGLPVKVEAPKSEKKANPSHKEKTKIDKGKQKNVSKDEHAEVEAPSSDTDEDDDMEALLNKAEEALRNQEQTETSER